MSDDRLKSAQEKSEHIASRLEQAAKLIGEPSTEEIIVNNSEAIKPGLGLPNQSAALYRRSQDMQEGVFKVLVFGQFSNGKSTLINSMLGNQKLQAKAVPTTSIITVLVHGNKNELVEVYYEQTNGDQEKKQSPRYMSWEQFEQEFTLKPEDNEHIKRDGYVDRFQDVRFAKLRNDFELLKNGVQLIDSPGLGDQTSRTKLATNFLHESHSIIFMLNALKIADQEERRFIKNELNEEGDFGHVFFVVNFANVVGDEIPIPGTSHPLAEVAEHLRKLLTPYYRENGSFNEAFYNRRIRFVDARAALRARMDIPDNIKEAANADQALSNRAIYDAGVQGMKKVLNALDGFPADQVHLIEHGYWQLLAHNTHLSSSVIDDLVDEASFEISELLLNAGFSGREMRKASTNYARLILTGIPALENEMAGFLTSDQKLSAVLNTTILPLRLSITVAQRSIARRRQAIQQPLTELEERWQEVEARLEGLHIKKQGIEDKIFRFADQVSSKIHHNLLEFINQMQIDWPIDSGMHEKQFTGSSIVNMDELTWKDFMIAAVKKKKIERVITDQMENYVNVKFDQWGDGVPELIAPDIEDMVRQVGKQVEDFVREIETIKRIFAEGMATKIHDGGSLSIGGSGANVAEGVLGVIAGSPEMLARSLMGKSTVMSIVKAYVRRVLVLYILANFMSMGWASIVLLVTELYTAGSKYMKIKQQIFEQIGESLFKELPDQIHKSEGEMRQKVVEMFNRYANEIIGDLNKRIEETAVEQKTIMADMREKSFSVEAESHRLDLISEELLFLYNDVYQTAYGSAVNQGDLEKIKKGIDEIVVTDS